jgi:hypothetical protein
MIREPKPGWRPKCGLCGKPMRNVDYQTWTCDSPVCSRGHWIIPVPWSERDKRMLKGRHYGCYG